MSIYYISINVSVFRILLYRLNPYDDFTCTTVGCSKICKNARENDFPYQKSNLCYFRLD